VKVFVNLFSNSVIHVCKVALSN